MTSRDFDHLCDGLVYAVQKAAKPYQPSRQGISWPDYAPYVGDPVSTAVWFAKAAVRQARRLGLYGPDPEDQIRVLLQVDVEAGDPVEVE